MREGNVFTGVCLSMGGCIPACTWAGEHPYHTLSRQRIQTRDVDSPLDSPGSATNLKFPSTTSVCDLMHGLDSFQGTDYIDTQV